MSGAIWAFGAAYALVGLVFLLRSTSRGVLEDLIFAAVWPWFLWRWFRHGV